MPSAKNQLSIPSNSSKRQARSVLTWPAWRRVLAVLPAVVVIALAVAWAQLEIAPW